jgi:hypothetical protein
MQSTYGTAYKANVNVDKTSVINPKPKSLEKIQMQKQLRINLEHENLDVSIVSIKLNDLSEC